MAPEILEVANLSLQLMVGLSSPKTMKVRREIEGQGVVFLIDSGATHNFIYEEIAKAHRRVMA